MQLDKRQLKLRAKALNRKPTIFEKASTGDKVARHMVSALGMDCDYLESDMDGPKEYNHNE